VFGVHFMSIRKTRENILIPRSVDIKLSPIEVAQSLRHLPGFLFFDTVNRSDECSFKDTLSIIGAMPDQVFRGHIVDQNNQLRDYYDEVGNFRQHVDCGFPIGGLFGHIGFNGKYKFGDYSKLLVYLHERNEWIDIGGLSNFISSHPTNATTINSLKFCGGMGEEAFCLMVEKAKEYIASGDIYQVNLSQRFEAEWPENKDPFDFFKALRECSPAPYSVFHEFAGETIISSSPECFLSMSGPGISTRPIKGTRPRFNDPGDDERSAAELITSPKEISELIMITDLERNDLGKVCEFGTVRVSELLKLEKYAQVFHLVSTIEGRLKPTIDHLSALISCFPGGSISGAPKSRALQIIDELETLPRDIYTGAIGYLGVNGESQFSIGIRTAYLRSGKLFLHAGAGIVADSDPQLEYQETLQKASGFFQAAMSF
tara:strand:+ start:7320 stop:8609 length:1290 start_codon:yes stop_codon:yes gene_type:complete